MLRKLVLFTLAFLALAAASHAETLSVAFSGTDIRSAPAVASSRVIFTAPVYYPVSVLEKGAEYVKVRDYVGRSGWVHQSLLKAQPAAIVTGDRANIRKGPGTGHAALFQMARGETAKIIGRQDNWLQIETADGRSGWVADFLVWGD